MLLIQLIRLLLSQIIVIVFIITRKEHFINIQIKAIYILKEKKSLSQIKEAIKVFKITIYRLYAIIKERK
jgi:hypothetical protein